MLRFLLAMIFAGVATVFPGSIAGIVSDRFPKVRLMVTKFWAKGILWMAGVSLRVEGLEHIAGTKAMYFVGNHQSSLDIPLLFSALPYQVRFMAKDALFRIPVFGWIIRRCGHVPVDRSSARRTLATLHRMLKASHREPFAVAVFPEGTRSTDGVLLPFRRGALKIGVLTGLPIVPFTIDGSVGVHARGNYHASAGKVRLVFHEPVLPEEASQLSPQELHDRVYQAISSALPSSCLPAGEPTAALDVAVAATEGI
ncbi:MAG: lysophospholipid acyltransferase family protein [Phycisphaerae bacterium]